MNDDQAERIAHRLWQISRWGETAEDVTRNLRNLIGEEATRKAILHAVTRVQVLSVQVLDELEALHPSAPAVIEPPANPRANWTTAKYRNRCKGHNSKGLPCLAPAMRGIGFCKAHRDQATTHTVTAMADLVDQLADTLPGREDAR